MKFFSLLLLSALLVACSPDGLFAQATRTPRHLSPSEVYLTELGDTFESLDASRRAITAQLDAEAKDATLFHDQTWRATLTHALLRFHQDYQTLLDFEPPVEMTAYHHAILDAEAHDDKAATWLDAWLDDQDVGKYQQAVAEFNALQVGLTQAQKILDATPNK